jgi:hypothetical protein
MWVEPADLRNDDHPATAISAPSDHRDRAFTFLSFLRSSSPATDSVAIHGYA